MGRPPQTIEPKQEWEHYELYKNVRQALFAVPTQFETDIFVEGLEAEDIFSLNATFATAIEESVVDTLNEMRSLWDKNSEYTNCRFIRQSQTFPDVLLVEQKGSNSYEPIMGIELKGWYLLSKEKEPSFRYEVTEDACASQDLIAVFPWCLSEVISGEPQVFEPFVESALKASKYVDYYWRKRNNSQCEIKNPSNVQPYPNKKDEIRDLPESDPGCNYGRLARTEMMKNYSQEMMNKKISGIEIEAWVNFLLDNRSSQQEIVSPSSQPDITADGGMQDPLEYEGEKENEVNAPGPLSGDFFDNSS